MDYEVPVHVAWQCTKACNLNCIHCYAEAGMRAENELETEEAKKLIGSVAKLGAKSMLFTGGEPLIRPDIFELIAYAKDAGLVPLVATNGTLINQEVARFLKETAAAVSINMPVLDKKMHEAFTRTSNSYHAKMKGLAHCIEEGVPLSLGVAVTSVNIHEVFEVVNFAYRINAYCDVLATIPVGRASAKILPSPIMYERLLRKLLREYSAVPMNITEQGSETKVAVYEPIYAAIMKEEGIQPPPKLCTVGRLMHVMEDGSVRTCVYLPLIAGNVRRQSLREIWRAILRSKFFAQLADPTSLRGLCGRCEHRDICGGCRARAYAITGDWFATDPICPRERLNERAVVETGRVLIR